MTDNMKKLLALLSSDEALSAKVNGASHEETIAIAKEHGITLTEADFEAASATLSDDELNVVSGGGEGRPICFPNGSFMRRPSRDRS